MMENRKTAKVTSLDLAKLITSKDKQIDLLKRGSVETAPKASPSGLLKRSSDMDLSSFNKTNNLKIN
jgi:hypothetical protein